MQSLQTGLRQPPSPQPECRSDADCPSLLACINARCINPCSQGHICTPDQQCRVLDTLPLRTIMCQCPADTITDTSGRCRAIEYEKPQCTNDLDCADADKCIRGSCVEACKVDVCGVNALCNSLAHQALCTCAPGYTGNPHVECANGEMNFCCVMSIKSCLLICFVFYGDDTTVLWWSYAWMRIWNVIVWLLFFLFSLYYCNSF